MSPRSLVVSISGTTARDASCSRTPPAASCCARRQWTRRVPAVRDRGCPACHHRPQVLHHHRPVRQPQLHAHRLEYAAHMNGLPSGPQQQRQNGTRAWWVSTSHAHQPPRRTHKRRNQVPSTASAGEFTSSVTAETSCRRASVGGSESAGSQRPASGSQTRQRQSSTAVSDVASKQRQNSAVPASAIPPVSHKCPAKGMSVSLSAR